MDFLMKLNKSNIYDIVCENGFALTDNSIATSILNAISVEGRLPENLINTDNLLNRNGGVYDVLRVDNDVYNNISWFYAKDNNIRVAELLSKIENEVKKSIDFFVIKNIISDVKIKSELKDNNIIILISFKEGSEKRELFFNIQKR